MIAEYGKFTFRFKFFIAYFIEKMLEEKSIFSAKRIRKYLRKQV